MSLSTSLCPSPPVCTNHPNLPFLIPEGLQVCMAGRHVCTPLLLCDFIADLSPLEASCWLSWVLHHVVSRVISARKLWVVFRYNSYKPIHEQINSQNVKLTTHLTTDFYVPLTARIALSLSTKSANLSKRWPLSEASILLQTEPREKASRAALTALSVSTWEKGRRRLKTQVNNTSRLTESAVIQP